MVNPQQVKIKVEPPFRQLYELPPDINMAILIGGRGGRKTYEASKFIAVSSTVRDKRVAILRDEKETIRESILNEVFERYDTANQYGHLDPHFDKLETGIRNKKTGEMQVFTKGFRASSNEKKSNLKGVSNTDIAVVEEAEDIRSFEKFNTFKDSIRTEGRLIIIILNTPDIQHWIVKRYFTLIPGKDPRTGEELDGYWQLVPKNIPGFLAIQTSYKDNRHLPLDVIRDYEGYGNPESHNYDLHYYYTAILGYASSGRKGQIIRKAKPISLADYLAIDAKEYYGVDWGTASPAGIVGAKFVRNAMYGRELNYKPLDTLGVAKVFHQLQLTQNDIIVADSAEPLSIGKLRRGWPATELSQSDLEAYPRLTQGYNIRGAIKGPGSITAGIGLLNESELYITEDSTNIWNEIYNYVYNTNKAGEYTNEPMDGFNHTIDPLRYLRQAKGRLF